MHGPTQLVNIFAKPEASPDGCARGFGHTMLDDTDLGSTRHARAAISDLSLCVLGWLNTTDCRRGSVRNRSCFIKMLERQSVQSEAIAP